MSKKCVYCRCEIPDESVIDFCDTCGISVWGEKMFKTIKDNMEEARERGDLCNQRQIVKPAEQNSPTISRGFESNF